MSDPYAAEVLESGPPAAAPRRGARGLVVAGAAVAVAGIAGAAVAATAFLSGGGTQPEELIPAGALAYADVDLDPSAGQKANVARFLSHFDTLDTRLGVEDGWRPAILERLLGMSHVDAAQVDGWLGDRYGVAVLGVDAADLLGGQPPVVLAIQVSDSDAAVRWIDDQLDGDGSTLAVDDYVLVGDRGVDLDQVVADAKAGSLADSSDFRAAMDPLGDGVASAYVDLPALQQVAGAVAALTAGGGVPGLEGSGPAGYVLRVEPDSLEVAGGFDVADDAVPTTATTLADGLPSSTAAVLAVSGLGRTVAAQWDAMADQLSSGLSSGQLTQELRSVERSTGLVLPDDLTTLLGDDLVVAVDAADLVTSPAYGVRVLADPAASASLVDRVSPAVARATGGYGLVVEATTDGWVLASDRRYADQLVSGDGGFADQPQVRAALPDLGGAAYVGYLDLDALVELLAQGGEDDAAAFVTPLRALGVTATNEGGHVSATARLTLD